MNGGPVHPGDLLSAYADGQLSEDERATVDAHVQSCPACGHELEATRRAKAWISGLPAVEAPFGFFERMLLDPSDPRRRISATMRADSARFDSPSEPGPPTADAPGAFTPR